MRCAGIGTRVAPGMSYPAVLPAHAACDVAAPSMDVSIKKAPILIAAVLLPSYALGRAVRPENGEVTVIIRVSGKATAAGDSRLVPPRWGSLRAL
jgi:hypothetical protein